MKHAPLICAPAVLLGLTLALGGCNNRITADDVRADMTPELQSVALTAEQRKNQHARAIDHTLRQWHDDWDHLLLLDRPRRLSKYPIP